MVSGRLPDDVLHGDVATITRLRVETTTGMLDGGDIAARTERVRAAAAE